jgi:hypothetical protein
LKANVIDLGARRKLRQTETPVRKAQTVAENAAPLFDMTERRKEILQDERREVRRTILTGFIGAFVVVPNHGLVRVNIYDISEDGIAFDLESEMGQFNGGEEIAMRVYMNQNTYFPFIARVQNARTLEGGEFVRHGLSFVKGTVNDEALFHFVKFIETVSASLERDSGDVMVSNLKK